MVRQSVATIWRIVVALLLVALATGCTSSGRDSVIWPTEEWQTSAPEEQDMDPALLQQMMDLIDEQGFAYDAILVVRHGRLVFEEYRNGYNLDKRHHLLLSFATNPEVPEPEFAARLREHLDALACHKTD